MNARRGNPAWVKGKSANPKGRPRGQSTLAAYYRDPVLFRIRHHRWGLFCLQYALLRPTNATEAAKNAGYSPRSARFIAHRLLKKPVIQEIVDKYRKMRDLYYMRKQLKAEKM